MFRWPKPVYSETRITQYNTYTTDSDNTDLFKYSEEEGVTMAGCVNNYQPFSLSALDDSMSEQFPISTNSY